MAGFMDSVSYLAFKRASRWFQSAGRAIEDRRWDDAVYNCQMAVEHALKALLMSKGFIFKRVHDVTDVLVKLKEDSALSTYIRTNIDKMAEILIFLTDLRGLAGYGFEEGVDEHYFEKIAPEAMNKAKFVLETLSEHFR